MSQLSYIFRAIALPIADIREAVGILNVNIDLLAQLLGSIGNACAVAIVELVNGGALPTAYEADIAASQSSEPAM